MTSTGKSLMEKQKVDHRGLETKWPYSSAVLKIIAFPILEATDAAQAALVVSYLRICPSSVISAYITTPL